MVVSYYLAFAIEDCVDFSVLKSNNQVKPDFDQPAMHVSRQIKGNDYYASVRNCIFGCLNDFYVALSREQHGQSIDKDISTLKRIVISCCGVIENNRTLKQLTLWSWPTFDEVVWHRNGALKFGFDFKEEVFEIFLEIADQYDNQDLRKSLENNRETLMGRIFVVNDVAACAAAEYSIRSESDNRRSFVFIKAHNGVNVGTVMEGHDKGSSFNAELGHIYAPIYDWDEKNKFRGVCPFHENCVEGMISPHSFWRRADLGGSDNIWLGIKIRHLGSPQCDNIDNFTDDVLNCNAGISKLDNPTSSIIAHYLSYLIHTVILSPNSPADIILGGRLFTPPVRALIREKLRLMLRGYPNRNDLTSKSLKKRIRMSKHRNLTKMELWGAMVISLKETPAIVDLRRR